MHTYPWRVAYSIIKERGRPAISVSGKVPPCIGNDLTGIREWTAVHLSEPLKGASFISELASKKHQFTS